jgi:oxygen-independent coproporphyrinogen III oxidase
LQGLYVHIPFCKQACLYCDFHFSTQLKNKTELVKAICREIEVRHAYLKTRHLATIYFGGGTPSLLSDAELNAIFEKLSKHFDWDKKTEITFECNPDDLTKGKLQQLKKAGINRLSIGLQSFNEQELKWMNRAHNARESEASVKLAQDLGFDNITIDLIYGSRFQNMESWEDTLKKAVDLNVPHISSYNLTVEEKTALGNLVNKGKELRTDEDKSAEQFLFMTEFLENAGFDHYEISNFGKPGFESKHNSNYWKGHHYLGLGPSAHSFNGESRQWNVANNNAYTNALNSDVSFFEVEHLTVTNRFNEYLLTGLRTKWGCDLDFISKEFGEVHKRHFLEKIQNYLTEFAKEEKGIYSLTKKGRLFADKIAMELFV